MAFMGRKPTLKPVRQLAIGFPGDLMRGIEAFQSANSISNLAEAIRILIRRGLERDGWIQPPGKGGDDE